MSHSGIRLDFPVAEQHHLKMKIMPLSLTLPHQGAREKEICEIIRVFLLP